MTSCLRTALGVAIFVAWAVLALRTPAAAGFVAGTTLLIIGIVGLARRRISVSGRSGPSRTHVGRAAIGFSLLFVGIGAVLLLFFARRLWPLDLHTLWR